ncbi:hypothetical protein [Teichococcus aestuarii]|uniref:hypothetical protein n=1 Tax=Teichococcus aestuarii TaxID=568898 RepID=UPI0015E82345|nr:hypothetical protein [Pseudoroseomonas aestuarii]
MFTHPAANMKYQIFGTVFDMRFASSRRFQARLIRLLREWLLQGAYRPERRYMRGIANR